MATNKTILILREPKGVVSAAYLTRVLAACPNGGGYAIQAKNDKGETYLETDNSDTGASLSDIQDLIKAYDDSRMLLAFNKLETPKEHMFQPFHVAIDGDDTLLSYGIDGQFPTMVEAGHTEESLLAQRVMFPNIQKFIKYSGGDLDKFVAELRDPTFVDAVMARIGERGSFCFLAPTGEAIWLGKNKAGSTFPWGTVSDTLGYTEAPASTATVATAAPAKKGWWGKNKGPEVPVAEGTTEPKVEPKQPAPPPGPLNIPAAAPDTKVVPPAATPAPVEAPVMPTEPPKGEYKMIPKGLSKDQRKKMIRRVTNCGNQLPELWNVDPFWYWEVHYPKDERIAALIEQSGGTPKDMRHKAPRPAATKGSEVDVLIMSKDERNAIETHILQTMNRVSKEQRNPLDIQKDESKYAKFSDEFGIKLELLNQWTPKELRLLGPKGLIHYALESRRQLATIKQALTGDTPVTSAEAPAPATTSEAAPPRVKGWGKQPKAA